MGHNFSQLQQQWDTVTPSEGTYTLIIRALKINALMITGAPAVQPVSVHQFLLSVFINATSMPHISAYQCTSMPHISAHLSCLSVSPISASQCHLSMPVSATYQCQSV
ncbi:unnamed protein product, partial [Staurois parvus]